MFASSGRDYGPVITLHGFVFGGLARSVRSERREEKQRRDRGVKRARPASIAGETRFMAAGPDSRASRHLRRAGPMFCVETSRTTRRMAFYFAPMRSPSPNMSRRPSARPRFQLRSPATNGSPLLRHSSSLHSRHRPSHLVASNLSTVTERPINDGSVKTRNQPVHKSLTAGLVTQPDWQMTEQSPRRFPNEPLQTTGSCINNRNVKNAAFLEERHASSQRCDFTELLGRRMLT